MPVKRYAKYQAPAGKQKVSGVNKINYSPAPEPFNKFGKIVPRNTAICIIPNKVALNIS